MSSAATDFGPLGSSLANQPEMLMVELARQGDQAAFAELVVRRQSWIRTLMRRQCGGDYALADDLAQTVFMNMWRDLPKLRDRHRFGGWLKRLAVNVWLQHLRSTSREDEVLEEVRQERLQTSTQGISGAPQSVDVGAGALDQSPTPEISRDLDLALASLAPIERTCVVLAYHEGMSHREIAEVTELAPGTVKSHIRRGSIRLRERLAAYRQETDTPNGSSSNE